MFGLFSFIASPIGKIVSIVTVIAALFSAFLIALKIHDNSIKNAALLKFNQKQMELVIQQQKETLNHLNNISKSQNIIIKDMNEKNLELTNKLNDLDSFLNSPEAVSNDKQSSKILKKVFKDLQKGNQ